MIYVLNYSTNAVINNKFNNVDPTNEVKIKTFRIILLIAAKTLHESYITLFLAASSSMNLPLIERLKLNKL